MKTGFSWALGYGFDSVIGVDADGQHLPSEIPKLLRCRAETGADMVIGAVSNGCEVARRSEPYSMEVVARHFADSVQRPEFVRAHGALAILVLQYAFDDQARRTDDERAMIAEESRLHDRL